jgi:signal transduction histidine kinase
MTFADELKSYLLQVQQGDMQVEPRLIELDTTWIRGVAIQLFEQLERQEGGNLSPEAFGHRFSVWMEPPKRSPWMEQPEPLAERFTTRLSRLLQSSFLKGASRSELTHYVRLGLALQIGVKEEAPSLSRRMELKRLAAIVLSGLDTAETVNVEWGNVSEYALEIRAVRKSGTRLELTPIGSVFLGLAGRNAVQWLLSVEVAQSTGPRDEWRLSRDAVSALLEQHEATWISPHEDSYRSPCSRSTLRRLWAMGLMFLLEEEDPEATAEGYSGYRLLETGIQAMKALAEPAGTPFSVLAATLSNDEALATLAGLPGKQAGAVRFQASAEATALQARLVAHEIRNALLPVQSALDSLYEGVVGQQLETQMGRLRPRIDSGIERVLSFVRELLTTSELATQPPEPFELNLAFEEARASFAANLTIQVTGANLGSSTVDGYRGRFVLALVNLLRNAEQAGARSVVLDLKWDEGGQGLLLTLDDDGSGVPAEQRERIFQPGVSLRGGTGVGLALVREVIESEMHGKVACQEAPGGGARFLMRLPLKERRSR